MLRKSIKVICILFVLCVAFSGCYGDYKFYDNNTANISGAGSNAVTNNTAESSNTTLDNLPNSSTTSDAISLVPSSNLNTSSANSSTNVSSSVSQSSKPTQSTQSETTISSTVSVTTSSSDELVNKDAPVVLSEHMINVLCNTFLELINNERVLLGLPRLTIDVTLQNTAMLRANETVELFSHTRPNGQSFWTALPKDYSYFSCGENITMSTYGIKVDELDLSDTGLIEMATKAFTNFRNSEPHYENIIKKEYNFTGIGFCTGYYVSEKYKDVKFVAIFCTNLFAGK